MIAKDRGTDNKGQETENGKFQTGLSQARRESVHRVSSAAQSKKLRLRKNAI